MITNSQYFYVKLPEDPLLKSHNTRNFTLFVFSFISVRVDCTITVDAYITGIGSKWVKIFHYFVRVVSRTIHMIICICSDTCHIYYRMLSMDNPCVLHRQASRAIQYSFHFLSK